jgi:hypothetical protein
MFQTLNKKKAGRARTRKLFGQLPLERSQEPHLDLVAININLHMT